MRISDWSSDVYSSDRRANHTNGAAAPNSATPIKGYSIQTLRPKASDMITKSQYCRMVSFGTTNKAIKRVMRLALNMFTAWLSQTMSVRELQTVANSYSQHSLTQLREDRKSTRLNSSH